MSRSTGWRMTWLALPLSVLGAHCATAHIASTVAPDGPASPYDRLLVVFSLEDLRERELTEAQFSKVSADSGTSFLGSSTVLPIGDRYTTVALQRVIDANDVDAVLVVLRSDDPVLGGARPGAAEVMRLLANASLTTVLNAAVGGASGGRSAGEPGRTSTDQFGVPDPWIRFTAVLYDAESGKVAWAATARSEGALAMPGGLFRAIARKTVERLRMDGLIR